jgi:predicted DNA-binding transcriptional regulator AlpA
MKFHSHDELQQQGMVRSAVTTWRWVEQGIFPPPFDLGRNSVAWADEDIQERAERVKAGLATTPNPKWLARNAERKARKAAARQSAAA